MIANISKNAATVKGIFNYNQQKVIEGTATLLNIENVLKPAYGGNSSWEKIAKATILSQALQSKRKNKFLHVSLNFPIEDSLKINNDILIDIAKDYMKEMGYPEEHPFAIYRHNDTQHPHIHIVSTRIDKNGNFINDSNEWKRSQEITRELEKKYNLTQVSSEKKELISYEFKMPKESAPLRERLNYHIQFALKQQRVTSLKQLQEYLNENNIDIAKLSGINASYINYSGLIFHDINDDFKQNQRGIKASSLYFQPTEKNLEKQFKINTNILSKEKQFIKNTIDYLLKRYNYINIEDYKKMLSEKGIVVYSKFDSKNNLVGLSYSNEKGRKFTAEQIGKNYTAKNMSNKIGQSETKLNPIIITQNNIKLFLPKIDKLARNNTQKLKLYMAIGMRVAIENNSIYVSDYKNNSNEGYIKLNINNTADINKDELKNYAILHQITYKEKDIPFFNENRKSIMKGINIMEEQNIKIDLPEEDTSISQYDIIEEYGEKDTTYNFSSSHINTGTSAKVEDIDKENNEDKKKRRKRVKR